MDSPEPQKGLAQSRDAWLASMTGAVVEHPEHAPSRAIALLVGHDLDDQPLEGLDASEVFPLRSSLF